MPRIAFSPQGVKAGQFVVNIQNDAVTDSVYFSVPEDFHAHHDCVAVALATLCGRAYEEVYFDFPVSAAAVSAIAGRTGASVTANGECQPRQRGKHTALNFSGGFDSMTAWLLAPESQIRIAVAFGHWFKRESDFFRTLHPEISCETDLRQKGYAKNDWMFMAAASILYTDYLDLAAIGFGTIFEAEPGNFKLSSSLRTNPLFDVIGITDATLTRGLTEFGTAKIMTSCARELVDASIVSLAAPNSEKQLRKRLLIQAANHYSGGAYPEFGHHSRSKDRHLYGKSFVIDFLTLILGCLYGPALVSLWIDNAEDIDFESLRQIDVAWAFKWNPLFDKHIPAELLSTAVSRLPKFGISVFNADDWKHYEAIRKILAIKHKLP